jgi:hypothetical protein
MKFDARLGDRGWVYDADGLLIPHPISGDTDTGEVTCYTLAGDGSPAVSGDGTQLLTVTRFFPPPLRVLPALAGKAPPPSLEQALALYERNET